MNVKTTITILLFFIPLSIYSQDLEEYFGKYQSINSEFKVSFILNEHGILNLSVNEISIDSVFFDYHILGKWRPIASTTPLKKTMSFYISFNDNEKYNNVMGLFISKIEEEIILIICDYIQFKKDDKDDEDKYTDVKKQALEFSYEK